MAAANWRTLKKLDAHIHILPDAVHTANPDADDVWMYADCGNMCRSCVKTISNGPSSCPLTIRF